MDISLGLDSNPTCHGLTRIYLKNRLFAILETIWKTALEKLIHSTRWKYFTSTLLACGKVQKKSDPKTAKCCIMLPLTCLFITCIFFSASTQSIKPTHSLSFALRILILKRFRGWLLYLCSFFSCHHFYTSKHFQRNTKSIPRFEYEKEKKNDY